MSGKKQSAILIIATLLFSLIAFADPAGVSTEISGIGGSSGAGVPSAASGVVAGTAPTVSMLVPVTIVGTATISSHTPTTTTTGLTAVPSEGIQHFATQTDTGTFDTFNSVESVNGLGVFTIAIVGGEIRLLNNDEDTGSFLGGADITPLAGQTFAYAYFPGDEAPDPDKLRIVAQSTGTNGDEIWYIAIDLDGSQNIPGAPTFDFQFRIEGPAAQDMNLGGDGWTIDERQRGVLPAMTSGTSTAIAGSIDFAGDVDAAAFVITDGGGISWGDSADNGEVPPAPDLDRCNGTDFDGVTLYAACELDEVVGSDMFAWKTTVATDTELTLDSTTGADLLTDVFCNTTDCVFGGYTTDGSGDTSADVAIVDIATWVDRAVRSIDDLEDNRVIDVGLDITTTPDTFFVISTQGPGTSTLENVWTIAASPGAITETDDKSISELDPYGSITGTTGVKRYIVYGRAYSQYAAFTTDLISDTSTLTPEFFIYVDKAGTTTEKYTGATYDGIVQVLKLHGEATEFEDTFIFVTGNVPEFSLTTLLIAVLISGFVLMFIIRRKR